MANRLQAYFADQFQHIRQFFNNAKTSLGETDIHELRLALKKVRALLTMVDAVVPSFRLQKTMAPFELIFDMAANVREAQLQYRMTPQLPASPLTRAFRNRVKKKAAREQEHLIQGCTAKAWKKVKSSGNKVKSALRNVSRKKAFRFVKQHQKKLVKKLAKDIPPSALHDLRKALKNQHYYENMLGTKKKNTLTDALQALIGRWHDDVVLLEGLQETNATDSLPEDQRKAHVQVLRALRERIQANLHRIYKRQHRILKKL